MGRKDKEKQMPVEKYDFDLSGLLTVTQRLVAGGASRSDVIVYLHAESISIVSSVEVISDLYKTDMTTGKKIVFSHPVWKQVAENASVLHESLIGDLESKGKFVEKEGIVTITLKL